MKLWSKGFEINKEIERFTVGRDREMDLYLAKYDVMGSMAHITMLNSIGLIADDELPVLLKELRKIYAICEKGEFVIEDDIEDVHSQVELMLTRALGDMGKKIHSGRSRNDQVLVDLKLFTRAKAQRLSLTSLLQSQSSIRMCLCLVIPIFRLLCQAVSDFGLVLMQNRSQTICCTSSQLIR